MAVPKTAVDKYACAIFAQHYVGMSWQPWVIKPVSEPARKQILSDYHFRLGVSRMYGSHIFVSLFFSASVHRPDL